MGRSMVWSLCVLFASVHGACGSESEAPVDPPGTVTTQLLFTAPSSPSIRFATGSTSAGPFDLTLDTSTNFRGTIATVGPVNGLGEITAVPTSGFVDVMAAEVGHGYVVRVADGLGTHYRVYVEDDVLNTMNGIIGKKIRWAPLSLLASMTIAPANPTVIRPPPPPVNGPNNCALDTSLVLYVNSVTYTDGSAGGRITSDSFVWTSDGPGFLDYSFVDPIDGRITVSGGDVSGNDICPPTRIQDYNVWVTAVGNTPSATNVVKVRS